MKHLSLYLDDDGFVHLVANDRADARFDMFCNGCHVSPSSFRS
jgi:hypothetical protein